MTLVITDGDPQEIAAVDAAVGLHLPNTERGRCRWHIVDRGWACHCPRKVNVEFGQTNLIKILQGWMNSWMKRGFCETREEYEISKALFKTYLSSTEVKLAFGDSVDIIKSFHAANVEDYETNFFFHLQKGIRR